MRILFTIILSMAALITCAAQTRFTPSDNIQGTRVIEATKIISEEGAGDVMRACYVRWGETPGTAIITNLFSSISTEIEVCVSVDEEEHTVMLKPQSLGTYNVNDVPTNLSLDVYLSVDEDEYEEWIKVDEAIGRITDNGSINLQAYKLILRNDDKTLFGYVYPNLVPAPDYLPSAPEWHLAGEAEFSDGCFSGYSNGIYEPDTLKYWTNPEKPGWYAFENPYLSEFWGYYGDLSEGGSRNGWIVVDASNPDCVCVMPFVPSGLWLIDKEAYMLNLEGYRYVCEGITPEEQLNNWDWESGRKPSVMEGGKILLENMVFYYTYTPLDLKILPINFSSASFEFKTTGISDIACDKDVTSRYFNLQGIEVKHPCEGDIMIRRQGNRCEKIVY